MAASAPRKVNNLQIMFEFVRVSLRKPVLQCITVYNLLVMNEPVLISYYLYKREIAR